MAMAKVFCNHVPNCKVFTPNGRQIMFINGKHITQFQPDIDYLQSLVDAGDDYVHVNQAELEVDTEELTVEGRIKKLKREAVEEYLATVAAASGVQPGTQQAALNPGSSADLIAAVQSNGAATVTQDNVVHTPGAAVAPASGIKVTAPSK